MENPSVFLYNPFDARVENHPTPDTESPTDVIIQMSHIGVCGSDIHFWTEGGVGGNVVSASEPLIMGHEGSGVVHAVGSGVTHLKKGDRVAVEGSFPCRLCARCTEGSYHLCPHLKFAAEPPNSHGMLTKFYRANAQMCHVLSEGTSMEEGALVEPLAVAVHAVRTVGVRLGQTVVVFGSGTIGLLCGVVAAVYGANKIIAVDINDYKLAFAKDFHKCSTYKYATSESPDENSKRIRKTFDLGLGADSVIEASGVESSVNCGLRVLRKGGHFVQTGLGKPEINNFPLVLVGQSELHLHGDCRYGPGDFEIARDVLERGTVPFKKLISRVFPFEKATEAWEETKSGKGIKNMIQAPK